MIAMVLAQDAVIMVMDEPTAFLDISSKFDVIHLMRDLTQQRNKTIIYSTHDFNTAISQADKVWFITEDGLLEGAPEDIMLRGSFKNLFDESKVIFNAQDGSFSIRNESRGNVEIKGEGAERYWTEKALTRPKERLTPRL
jgi:iron complex transport system ATP-binding protein